MLWVGITGGLGSGKSTVSSILRSMGYPVLDADEISHQQILPGSLAYKEILQAFGPVILNFDKSINRKKLAEFVFSNPDHLLKLENILHPKIQKKVSEIKKELSENHQLSFYDVPLLFEKKLENNFDYIVVVDCSYELRKVRVLSRTGWSEKEYLKRLSFQIPLEEKVKKTQFIIKNDGDLEKLKAEILRVLELLKRPVS